MTPRQPAPTSTVPIGRGVGCVEREERRSSCQPVLLLSLRCRACEHEHALDAARRVRALLRPARSRLRQRRPSRDAQPRGDRGRAAVALALRAAPPRRAAGRAAARARPHAARRGAPARRGARRRRALPQARHGEPDPLVQGPRRRRRVREGARARARHARLLVDRATSRTPSQRAPPPRGSRPPSSARRASSREKLIATAVYGATIYAVDGTYDDCSRLSVELSFELDWAFVNVGLRAYYAEGSKTLAFEIAEQLGWELPDAVVGPIASGRDVLEGPPGLRRAARARPRRR